MTLFGWKLQKAIVRSKGKQHALATGMAGENIFNWKLRPIN